MCGKWFKWNPETDEITQYDAATDRDNYLSARTADGKLLRAIGQENVGKYWVSTVNLGLCHAFQGEGCPKIFETMVFDHSDSANKYAEEYCERASTPDEARAMHKRGIEWAENKLKEEIDTAPT